MLLGGLQQGKGGREDEVRRMMVGAGWGRYEGLFKRMRAPPQGKCCGACLSAAGSCSSGWLAGVLTG